MTDPRIIRIADEVRRLADQHPNHRYTPNPECAYHPDPENPNGCLIGWAARNVGYSLDHPVYQDYGVKEALALQFGLGRVWPGSSIDRELRWIHAVQYQQDWGWTWGDAVDYADNLAVLPTLADA